MRNFEPEQLAWLQQLLVTPEVDQLLTQQWLNELLNENPTPHPVINSMQNNTLRTHESRRARMPTYETRSRKKVADMTPEELAEYRKINRNNARVGRAKRKIKHNEFLKHSENIRVENQELENEVAKLGQRRTQLLIIARSSLELFSTPTEQQVPELTPVCTKTNSI
jgi:hypothetical protein